MQKFRHIIHIIIAFFSDYLSLFGRPLFYQIQHQLFRNDFSGRKKNNRLCILGNGPSFSLVEKHLEELNNVDFLAVNQSINTELFFKLKPKMFVIVDMIYWMHPDSEFVVKTYENAKRIDWNIEIFLPFNFPSYMKRELESNSFITVCRYANNSWEPELKGAQQLKWWLYKKGLVSPNGSNVSLAAIYTAILNGYKNIYLFGVEHSWMRDVRVNAQNEVVLIDRHYYGDTEHVWVDYEGKPIHLIDFLSSQLCTFTMHMNLRRFADYLGDVKIINCTEGSYIDAYERGKLEDIINGDAQVE